MYIFLDTEFTDFKHMDLISIGAVTECGNHEFYQEVNNHIADYRSDFVKEVVIPLLDLDVYGKSYDWVSLMFSQWLNDLPGDNHVIVIDYMGDFVLAGQLLSKNRPSKSVSYMMITNALTQVLQERGLYTPAKANLAINTFMDQASKYYDIDSRVHHALIDAKANRHGWISALNICK